MTNHPEIGLIAGISLIVSGGGLAYQGIFPKFSKTLCQDFRKSSSKCADVAERLDLVQFQKGSRSFLPEVAWNSGEDKVTLG